MVDGPGHVVVSEAAVDLARLERCGRHLGRALVAGDVVFLEGPLGAGKTTFVRAVARALGVSDPVRSPSFTIANIYAGRLTVQHLDLYRLEDVEDEDALALEEYVDGEAVTLVEWPETGRQRLGEPSWTVALEHESLETRRLEICACSTAARDRWQEADAGE